jgi:hypothetical protein
VLRIKSRIGLHLDDWLAAARILLWAEYADVYLCIKLAGVWLCLPIALEHRFNGLKDTFLVSNTPYPLFVLRDSLGSRLFVSATLYPVQHLHSSAGAYSPLIVSPLSST